jgi:hypothetical protein
MEKKLKYLFHHAKKIIYNLSKKNPLKKKATKNPSRVIIIIIITL